MEDTDFGERMQIPKRCIDLLPVWSAGHGPVLQACGFASALEMWNLLSHGTSEILIVISGFVTGGTRVSYCMYFNVAIKILSL